MHQIWKHAHFIIFLTYDPCAETEFCCFDSIPFSPPLPETPPYPCKPHFVFGSETLRTEAQVRLCGRLQGGDAGGAREEDYPRPWGHDVQKIPARQACLPRSPEVRAPRGVQAVGEYAYALGSRP